MDVRYLGYREGGPGWRQCPGDCGLHSMAGHGQDGVVGWCLLAVPDRSMRSYRLASVHKSSH